MEGVKRTAKSSLPRITGPEAIKLFSCSTQMKMELFVGSVNIKLQANGGLFLLRTVANVIRSGMAF